MAAPETTTPRIVPTAQQAARTELEWTVWPLRDRPAFWLWLPLLLTAVSLGVGWRLDSALLGSGAMILVLLTLLPSLLPTTYRVSRQHLLVSRLGVRRKIGWARVRAIRSRNDSEVVFAQALNPQGALEWSAVRVTFPRVDSPLRDEFKRRVQEARATSAA